MKGKITKKNISLETIASAISKLDAGLNKRIYSLQNTIDDLTISTANGFRDVEMRLAKKIDTVDIRVNGVETKLAHIEKTLNSKIDSLDAKITDLNFHKVRDEVYLLTKRVGVLETKVR